MALATLGKGPDGSDAIVGDDGVAVVSGLKTGTNQLVFTVDSDNECKFAVNLVPEKGRFADLGTHTCTPQKIARQENTRQDTQSLSGASEAAARWLLRVR